jgi:hypothetical protein
MGWEHEREKELEINKRKKRGTCHKEITGDMHTQWKLATLMNKLLIYSQAINGSINFFLKKMYFSKKLKKKK